MIDVDFTQRAELYILTFPNGKQYIGQTSRTAEERYKDHAAELNSRDKRNRPIYSAWRKHGAPTLSVLCIGQLRFILDLEAKAISEFETMVPNGYNLAPGGEQSPMKSKAVSTRLGEKMRGRKLGDAWRANVSASLQAMKHRPTDSAIAKAAQMRRGTKLSEETRKRMSDHAKTRTYSPETRAKMSESAKRRCARERSNQCAG